MGIRTTLAALGPMLQKPSENPHATIITHFMNAFHEIKALMGKDFDLMVSRNATFKVMPYFVTPKPQYDDPRLRAFLMVDSITLGFRQDLETVFSR